MSQTVVGKVVEQLLTDENLRIRFALDRIETVAELCLRTAAVRPPRTTCGYLGGRREITREQEKLSWAN